MAMGMANGRMGFLNLGGCGVLLPDLHPNSSSGNGFLISPKAVSLNCVIVRKSWVFDVRTAKCGVVSAVASREVGAGSSELRHIEKELKFSPTFTDYVKIMESVKLDRSKNSDGWSTKKRLIGKRGASESVGVEGEKKSDNLRKKPSETNKGYHGVRGKKNGVRLNSAKNDKKKNVARLAKKAAPSDIESSRGGWGHVQELLDKRITRSNGKGRGEMEETGENFGTKYGKQFASCVNNRATKGNMVDRQSEARRTVVLNAQKDAQQHEISSGCGVSTLMNGNNMWRNTEPTAKMEKGHVSSARGKMSDREISNARDKNLYHGKVNADEKFRRSQQSIEPFGRKISMNRGKENGTKCVTTALSRTTYDHVEKSPKRDRNPSYIDGMKSAGQKAIQMRLEKDARSDKFVTSGLNSTDFDDRAAFKTFEVFTDVRNRPRVLRMEMEERIQKLASRLNATDINMPEWQFSKMIHGAKIKFSDHSILRIVQILGRFGNWKRVLQVVEWLRSRERFKSYKSRYIYTTVLDVLGKAKRPFEALNVFYTMLEQLSSYPDVAAYHCIAVTLGQAGLMKELFDVIDCMRAPPKKKFKLGPLQKWDPRLEPDLIVYNAVLNACVQQKQWEGAFWVLQQLKQQNIRPTNTTYGLVMEVMLACGRYNLVYEFFRKVEKSSIPGALNYKVLINALWREGKMDEAVLAVKDMEGRGIVGSASLYYDLARCLCSGGRCQEAFLQIEKICKVANKPLVVTYTGLIQACIDSGSMENAKYIFDQMHKFCSPNTVTCNIMLKSYIEHGMFEDAKDLFCNILDGSHHTSSRMDLSNKAVPDKFTFNTFMEACAETKNWDDFEYAFREMLSHGYHFDARRHLRLVLDAFRDRKGQVLEATWEHLLDYGRVPPTPIIMERFCLELREGATAAAISCITRFWETEIRNVSSESWLNLLVDNADHLKKENIVKLVQEINSLAGSTSPPDSLYQSILSACTQFLSDATASENVHTDQQMVICD